MSEQTIVSFSEQTSASYYMCNREILEASDFSVRVQPTHPSLYEVIRIMDGVPLFLEEHYERLLNSAASIHQNVDFTLEELRTQISTLAQTCGVTEQNIKLILYGFVQGIAETTCLYFIPTHYPEKEDYENGVACGLFHAERSNPQAKIINQSLRDATNAYIKEHSLYEVLLVNDNDEITEGSRSNMFFIKDGTLYTSPAHGVLPGITRQRILRVCEENGISVKEVVIPAAELPSYEAAFVSGTSPKVLPIRSIDEQTLDVHNETLRTVMKLYDDEIRRYMLRSLS